MNTPQKPQLHKHIVMPSCLRLPLKTKWFEMTKAGIKTEDYREINPYWYNRLFADAHKSKLIRQEACDNFRNPNSATNWNFENGYYFKFKQFSQNVMTLGYPKNGDTERILKLEHKGIEIRTGNPEWGAEPNKLYFVIMHGAILA
jgi:hypothetical protein